MIVGLGGNDIIRGRGGDDLMCGGRGPDALSGGTGDDRLLGQAGRDYIHGLTGDDNIRGGQGADALYPGLGRDRVWAGPDDDYINFGKFMNRPTDGHHDLVYGGPGNDTFNDITIDDVHGGKGRDKFDVADYRPGTSQVLDGGQGKNALTFSFFHLNHGALWKEVRINLSRDRINADGLTSKLGGLFRRLLLATPSTAHHWTVIGTSVNDYINGHFTYNPVSLYGRGGDDHLVSAFHSGNVLVGGAGADRLSGWAGNDLLRGGFGADILIGGQGDDTLRGGPDVDQGDAGTGTDTCISVEAPIPPRLTTRCEQ